MIWIPGRNKNYNEELYKLIDSIRVIKNLDFGNLRFEILDASVNHSYKLTTLSDGLKKGYINISEIDESGSVPNLYCDTCYCRRRNCGS